MKIACLIVTYTSAAQTMRMIERLNNGQFDFYIHLDKKADIKTHEGLFEIPNVYFITDRVDVRWAGYSTVQAAFNGIKQIIASGIQYDFINLITGQDYPIKSPEYIADFLANSIGKEFIEYKDFDTEWMEAKGRIDKYHLGNMKLVGKFRLEAILNFFIKRGKMPMDLKMYGVSTFWTLSPACALYVVDFIEHNKELEQFLKYTWGSDEFIFQTVLMNSPYKDAIVNNNYRYVDWSAGGARPRFLTTEDYDNIIASEGFFGRKFNIELDENILDLVDAHCLKAAETIK